MMITAKNRHFWGLWLLATLALVAYLAYTLFMGEDKRLFMPNELTGGHHQIGVACEACHTTPFADGKTSKKEFQQACESCHADVREKPFDSHPKAKFKDPRNADLLEKVDALHCIGCHTEHKPDKTHMGGYTQPKDFCIHCHANVGEERPSHKGMDFMTCNNSGCHNYHNNRALYTDFLVKHLHEPNILEKTQLPARDFAQRLAELVDYPHDQHPVEPLTKDDIEQPPNTVKREKQQETIEHDWLNTAHANAGVSCQACHVLPLPSAKVDESSTAVEQSTKQTETPDSQTTAVWQDKPDQQQSCGQCHALETQHFQEGKHGMRLKLGLSPMTPAMARLPMQKSSQHQTLNCTSCHSAHRFDTQQAAVDACLSCHADEHSLAYKSSPHYELWQQELAGTLGKGQGVSCASCHMPRVDMDVNDWMSRIVVMHNQNATLVPREKMLRPACLHCHGLEFSINAISDDALVNKNFTGQPTFKTDSLRLAEEEEKRHQAK
ncbi:MAG: cytochrome c3 family protein [bacterium]